MKERKRMLFHETQCVIIIRCTMTNHEVLIKMHSITVNFVINYQNYVMIKTSYC